MAAGVWVDGDVASALSAQLSLAWDKVQSSCEGSHTVTGTRKIRIAGKSVAMPASSQMA